MAKWWRFGRASPRAQRLSVAAGDRLLVLAPHADDETLGAGGLMAATAASGGQVKTVVLTDGARLRGPLEGAARDALVRARQVECRAALAALGAPDVTFLAARDRQLRRDAAGLVPELAEIIGRMRPSRIVLPHAADEHADHRAALRLVRAALRRAGRAGRQELLGYEIWTPSRPTHVFAYGQWVDTKRAAFGCYRETFGSVDLGAAVLGLNQYRAGMAAAETGWCEGFVALR